MKFSVRLRRQFILPPAAGERVILSLLDSLQTQVFRLRRRRLQSKKKSRLAAGDAPVQVATESALSDYTRNSDSKYFTKKVDSE